MYLKKIELNHYRNYKKQSVHFSDKINIFLGENAQGKTNLMESIHVLSLTKSHRQIKDKELIEWGQDFAKIKGFIQKKERDIELSLIIHKSGKKAIIGHSEQPKLSQYIGQLNVVLFAPEDLYLIKGAPSIRRRFLDMEIGQINAIYLFHLTQYQKILKQRNNYLKSSKIDVVYLDILTEQLITHGAILLNFRIQFLKEIEKLATKVTHILSQNKDALTIKYDTQIDYSDSDNVDSLVDKYTTLFMTNKQREIDQKMTLFGPHRDDILFFINDKNVQIYGSQGQQRTVVLSLKLAEIDVVAQEIGEYPVLLLDDVLSELDDNRQTFLLKAIENKVQTFITTTNIEGIQKNMIEPPLIFKISKGSVIHG